MAMRPATLWSSTYRGAIYSWRQVPPILVIESNVHYLMQEWVQSARIGQGFNTYPVPIKHIWRGTPASLITTELPLLFTVLTAIIGRNIHSSPLAAQETSRACCRLTSNACG